jgi:hypothetical protein
MASSIDDAIFSAELAERAALSRAALSRAASYRAQAKAALTEADRTYYARLARAEEAIATTERYIIECGSMPP